MFDNLICKEQDDFRAAILHASRNMSSRGETPLTINFPSVMPVAQVFGMHVIFDPNIPKDEIHVVSHRTRQIIKIQLGESHDEKCDNSTPDLRSTEQAAVN